MRRGRTAAFLLLLTAGCASAAYAPWAPRVSSASSVSSAVPGGAPSAVTGTSNQAGGTVSQRAAADARAILAKFVPPPGAVRLAKQPALPADAPSMGLNSADQADAVAYWRAAGTATALLTWEKAHISASFTRQDVIIGPPSWNTVYSLPAVPGLLSTREMNVQFYDSSGGSTVIMAAAMVAWEPPRPAAEAIPASVTQVTITPLGPWRGHPVPLTVTSAPVVRRLAELVNGLPLSTAGDAPCPSGPMDFSLTFRAAAGGPPVAYAAPGACSSLSLQLDGKDEPALQAPDSFLATVLKIAGLNWKQLG
jgi:hypothetical protein